MTALAELLVGHRKIKKNPMDLIQNATSGGYFTNNEIAELRGKKVQAKISDVDYLKTHPEVEQVIELLYMSVLEHKPPRDQLYVLWPTSLDSLTKSGNGRWGSLKTEGCYPLNPLGPLTYR